MFHRYPLHDNISMDTGDHWDIPAGAVSFNFAIGAYISRWDDDLAVDSINEPDLLGNKLFLTSYTSGEVTITAHNNAPYTLKLELSNAS